MTTFEAIAGVTATLRNLLRDRMANPVAITIAPPDVAVTGATGQRANIYLYQVSENAYLKNQQIPGQGSPANFGRPPLSLELAYLVTAYGTSPDGPDADLQAQQVLGDVMQVFQDYPVVGETLHENDNPADPLVLDPSLRGAFERLKLTLQPSSLDDVTKIWAALPDAAFRRSVTYHVSAIQLDSRRERRQALPVQRRVVRAFPFRSPQIDRIFRESDANLAPRVANAEVGDTLVIVGQNLQSSRTQLRIGSVLVTPTRVEERRLELTVPATVSAGTQTLQVLQPPSGTEDPADATSSALQIQSNVVPISIQPKIQSVNPGTASAGDSISIGVSPNVSATQSRALFLNEIEIRGEAPSPTSAPASTLSFQLPIGSRAVAPGKYLLRLRIDGVDSRLLVDASSQTYTGPTFTVNP